MGRIRITPQNAGAYLGKITGILQDPNRVVNFILGCLDPTRFPHLVWRGDDVEGFGLIDGVLEYGPDGVPQFRVIESDGVAPDEVDALASLLDAHRVVFTGAGRDITPSSRNVSPDGRY